MSAVVRIGDQVWWKGAFGMQPPKLAKVEAMERTEYPRDKYGVEDLESASWDLVRENKVLFTLDNGHWAYSEQIQPAVGVGEWA